MKTIKKQPNLAINDAHPKIRAYGLQEAHVAPFVGLRDENGRICNSFRVPQGKAWEYSDVSYAKSGNAWTALVIDIDRPEKLHEILHEGSSLQPNWIVFNRANGHAHAAYPLKKPVLMYPTSSQAPIEYLKDTEKKLIQALDGDPGYSGHLSRNPITQNSWNTESIWLRKEPWDLDELNDAVARYLPIDWKPIELLEGAIGRNCTLFKSLMNWAGREDNRFEDISMRAKFINSELESPLLHSELRSIIKSVSKYRKQWESRGWHNPAWLRKQKTLSIRGNQAKTRKNIERNQAILDDFNAGMKQNQIAVKYGLSRRQVIRILKSVTCPNTG